MPTNEIGYVFLGKELGPRSRNPDHYDQSGKVKFDRLKKSPLFEVAIERLQSGLTKGLKITLLCAQKDLVQCHRSLMVGHYLWESFKTDIQHFDHGGGLESQSQLEQPFIEAQGVQTDLLTCAEELSAIAYE